MLFLRSRTIGCQILREVGDGVAGDGHGRGAPGRAGGGLRVDAGGVVDKIIRKACRLDLLLRERPRQLVHDRADHLQMPQFLSTYRSNGNVPYPEKR